VDDDQAAVLANEAADLQHGDAVAGWADGHGELVVALVREVEDRVAQRVSEVLIRNSVFRAVARISSDPSADLPRVRY
jgi:hypothetical protein